MVTGVVVVAGIGEVIAGIETVGAVVSPESSLPQPAIARPMSECCGREGPGHEEPSSADWRSPQYGQSLTSSPIS